MALRVARLRICSVSRLSFFEKAKSADFYAYTDMENAEFYEDEYSTFYIWYYDGVNRYLLGNDYTIGEDGLAYHDEDGLIYPAGWIPEELYDPAVDWGANWMDSWDI